MDELLHLYPVFRIQGSIIHWFYQQSGNRLHRHNNNLNQYTKGKGPWVLIYSQSFDTRSEAVRLERFLKTKKDPKRVLQWINEQAG